MTREEQVLTARELWKALLVQADLAELGGVLLAVAARLRELGEEPFWVRTLEIAQDVVHEVKTRRA